MGGYIFGREPPINGRTLSLPWAPSGRARFSVGLESGGKFSAPQLVTINRSASCGFHWSRTGGRHDMRAIRLK